MFSAIFSLLAEFSDLNLRELLNVTGRPMALWMFAVLVFCCCIGSFLNVCIWRLPRGESLLYPPSHCPKCNHKIRVWENIPIISYLCLRGKCSSCGLSITPRYLIVEALTGILCGFAFLRLLETGAMPIVLPFYILFIAILVTAAFTDCDTHIIPDQITYLGIGAGLLYAFLCPTEWQTGLAWHGLFVATITTFSTAAILTGLTLIGHQLYGSNAFGWGDVKYLTAIVAFSGLKGLLFVLLFGSILALFGMLFLRIVKHRRRRAIAFGPFLSAAFYLWLVYGPVITVRYMNLASILSNAGK